MGALDPGRRWILLYAGAAPRRPEPVAPQARSNSAKPVGLSGLFRGREGLPELRNLFAGERRSRHQCPWRRPVTTVSTTSRTSRRPAAPGHRRRPSACEAFGRRALAGLRSWAAPTVGPAARRATIPRRRALFRQAPRFDARGLMASPGPGGGRPKSRALRQRVVGHRQQHDVGGPRLGRPARARAIRRRAFIARDSEENITE